MRFARALAGGALLATLVVLSSDSVLSQDKKDKDKIKGQLPTNWSKLDLSAAQKEKVYKITADYKAKIDKLNLEIKDLEAERNKERVAVLTAEQKKKLAELVGVEPSDPKDKKGKDGKDKDKGKN